MAPADPLLDGAAVVVTGGGGFIGSHLVRHLSAAGAARVGVLDRRPPSPDAAVPRDPRVSFRLVALEPDARALRVHLRGVDYLFHLAALKHSDPAATAGEILATNVGATCALLEAAAAEGVKRLVFASSVYAYGRQTGPPLVETEPCRPHTVYGISKLAGELLVEHFRRRAGLDGVVLRYFFVYGPGQQGAGGREPIVPRTLRRLRRGEGAVVRGDGDQSLDYVYVDDLCRATLAALAPEAGGEVLNVGSGRPTTVRALVEAMMEATASRAPLEHEPPDETAGTARVADITRIRQRLGWSPRVTLAEGLARTLRWIEGEP
jgi:UDP-glucose 4-epimerase